MPRALAGVLDSPASLRAAQPQPMVQLPGRDHGNQLLRQCGITRDPAGTGHFSLINEKETRLAVGAVNVLNDNFIYFDNATDMIEPEHVMASGTLSPAPADGETGTDHFWNGGIVSNTPLQHLLDQDDHINTMVFQVDLFSARGALPRDIQDDMPPEGEGIVVHDVHRDTE